AAAFDAAGCKRNASQGGAIYTSVDQDFAQANLIAFDASSWIKGRAEHETEQAKATRALNRIDNEAPPPPADVAWAGDPIRTWALIKKGLVEPYTSPEATHSPAAFKASDGAWTEFAARARVLLVNKNKVRAEDAPKSVRDLASSKFKGQAAIANPLF